jgi:phosphoribosylaminoimidazolecarboxamide formyltransferase/IMP cyclohydrolase
MMFKNALVSVSDKTGLVEFLKPYVAKGLRVVSTGGTLKHLRENGIPAIEVSEQTGFPEVMDGRVKTLHPRIHMALLARLGNAEDTKLLEAEKLEPFDLVIVNLYPFEEARTKNLPDHELIEFIDIGGPSLLRAAAKNHERLAVVCEPEDYAWITAKNELTLTDRRRLAARVYRHTSRYDDLIAKTLATEEERPVTLVGRPVSELRYGENPHQKAWWYRDPMATSGLHEAKILHGKPLSYNNLLDLDAACGTVAEFSAPAAVAVKHNNPCGVGTDQKVSRAVELAIQADPVSVFGGIIAVNREIDLAAAEEMAKIFLECVVAPSFTPEAAERLKKKKDLRLLEWSRLAQSHPEKQFRSISGGFLVQTADRTSDWSNDWKIVSATNESPSDDIKRDLMLAWKVCARLKSNAIAIAAGGRTLGLGMGQVNRVDAVEQAIGRMHKHHGLASGVVPVLASDAFFPFADSIELAAKAGVRWIIQPGGSIRDEEVFAKARELGVNLVLTGVRHFRH